MTLQVGTGYVISAGDQDYLYTILKPIEYCAHINNGLVPDWIPTFDVRIPTDAATPKAEWNEYLHGADRASYMIGLIAGMGFSQDYAQLTFSFSPGYDLRADCMAFQYVLDEVAQMAVRLRDKFLTGNGYLPVFIWMNNFAGGVVCDRRVQGRAAVS